MTQRSRHTIAGLAMLAFATILIATSEPEIPWVYAASGTADGPNLLMGSAHPTRHARISVVRDLADAPSGPAMLQLDGDVRWADGSETVGWAIVDVRVLDCTTAEERGWKVWDSHPISGGGGTASLSLDESCDDDGVCTSELCVRLEPAEDNVADTARVLWSATVGAGGQGVDGDEEDVEAAISAAAPIEVTIELLDEEGA